MDHVGNHAHRWDRRRARVAGDGPGGHPDGPEDGEQYPVRAPALPLHDRAHQQQRRAEYPESDQMRRAILARQNLANVRAGDVAESAAGHIGHLQHQFQDRRQRDQAGTDPDHQNRPVPRQSLRPEQGQHQHRPDQQQQSHVPDPAHHRQRSQHGGRGVGAPTGRTRRPAGRWRLVGEGERAANRMAVRGDDPEGDQVGPDGVDGLERNDQLEAGRSGVVAVDPSAIGSDHPDLARHRVDHFGEGQHHLGRRSAERPSPRPGCCRRVPHGRSRARPARRRC